MRIKPVLTALLLSACAPGTVTPPAAESPVVTAPAVRPPPTDEPPPMAREFRGVWVASVSNIDWPSKPGLPADSQRAELVALLDRVRQLRMNAVIFQVRPAGDALYASALEPWAEYLTGAMGQPPDPYYDPLAFAVEEAHKRGLELHAWFNPYRARHPSAKGELAPGHIARRRPDLVRTYGRHLWMDPGEPEVQEHSLNVVLDVVRRYDVDGVHIDDYFYPYRENDARGRLIDFPDDASYARYQRSGGTLARADWRRHNVDQFVRRLYESIKSVRPTVKFGISPFGIWRPGYPPQVQGLDAYVELYADSRKWLNEGWLDYFAPQLYWQIEAAQQSYPVLLDWWSQQNLKSRHLWPGNAAYRVRNDRQNWPAEEIAEQIRITREHDGATGNIHFSMRTLLNNQGGVSDALASQAYGYFALPPRTEWLDNQAPSAPRAIVSGSTLHLAPGTGEPPFLYALRLRRDGVWFADILPARQTSYDLLAPSGVLPDVVAVSAVDRHGNESALVKLWAR